jgi:dipeptidyl aminopeptidase/acylaminoacyl peptidase
MTPGGHEGVTGVTFDSDGHRLLGVLYLARDDRPKPTALVLHGCPGIEKNLDLAMALRDHGWNALVFHYRGCWGSAGRYDLRTIPRDVAAAAGYLQAGQHPSVDPARLAVIGHSLGGWAAIVTAAADQRLRAVAVCGSAVDLTALDLTPPETEREFTRFLAAEPTELARQRDDVAPRLRPLDLVGSISPRPLLIVHGSADEWVPVAQARRLHACAGPPREYVEIDGANHAFSWHRARLRDLIVGWLDQTGA